MMLFRLNHICYLPGCVGGPGDVINITAEQVANLLGRQGGCVVEEITATPPQPTAVVNAADAPATTPAATPAATPKREKEKGKPTDGNSGKGDSNAKGK